MRTRKLLVVLVVCAAVLLFANTLPAQEPPAALAPDHLDNLVARVALYPDPLLVNVLAAATFSDQIPDAAQWADQHHYLTGQALATAIQQDQLSWDPTVQALLPFPSVLEIMASDMAWTTQLGNAFLTQQQDVMDAVQRERHKAYNFGYLSNGQLHVIGGDTITILPVNPGYIIVPAYDPAIVFFPPRYEAFSDDLDPGLFVGGEIHYGFGVTLGAFFQPWGWGSGRVDWGGHRVFIANAPWGRTWDNRATYMHPFPNVRRFKPEEHTPEHHQLTPRTEEERKAARQGTIAPKEEHHGR